MGGRGCASTGQVGPGDLDVSVLTLQANISNHEDPPVQCLYTLSSPSSLPEQDCGVVLGQGVDALGVTGPEWQTMLFASHSGKSLPSLQ